MNEERKITWGQFQSGELLASWPRRENGELEEPAFLCLRACSDLADRLTVSMLKAYGIPCLCMERAEGGYGVEIYVPKNLLEDAKTLLEESDREA